MTTTLLPPRPAAALPVLAPLPPRDVRYVARPVAGERPVLGLRGPSDTGTTLLRSLRLVAV